MDALGRTVSTAPEGYTWATTSYDVLGNATLVTDPAGIQTKSIYSNLSELTSEIDYFGTASAATTGYTYNPAGWLKDIDGPRTAVNDTITYAYDRLGRLVTSTYDGVTLPNSTTKASVSVVFQHSRNVA